MRGCILRLDLQGEAKIEIEDDTLENVSRFTDSKLISVTVRSFMWKLAHNIIYSEINEAKT